MITIAYPKGNNNTDNNHTWTGTLQNHFSAGFGFGKFRTFRPFKIWKKPVLNSEAFHNITLCYITLRSLAATLLFSWTDLSWLDLTQPGVWAVGWDMAASQSRKRAVENSTDEIAIFSIRGWSDPPLLYSVSMGFIYTIYNTYTYIYIYIILYIYYIYIHYVYLYIQL